MEMVILQTKTEKIKLVLDSDRYCNENGETYIGYGFTAYRTHPLREVYSIRDLSTDADEVRDLMQRIVDFDVSLVHFQDLVEDFCV